MNILRVQQENMALLRTVIDNPGKKPNGEEEPEQEAPLGVQADDADADTPSVHILLEAIPGSGPEDSGQAAVNKSDNEESKYVNWSTNSRSCWSQSCCLPQ